MRIFCALSTRFFFFFFGIGSFQEKLPVPDQYANLLSGFTAGAKATSYEQPFVRPGKNYSDKMEASEDNLLIMVPSNSLI